VLYFKNKRVAKSLVKLFNFLMSVAYTGINNFSRIASLSSDYEILN